jgi:hypothetical protein
MHPAICRAIIFFRFVKEYPAQGRIVSAHLVDTKSNRSVVAINQIFAAREISDHLHRCDALKRFGIERLHREPTALFIPIHEIESDLARPGVRQVNLHRHGLQTALRVLRVNAPHVPGKAIGPAWRGRAGINCVGLPAGIGI